MKRFATIGLALMAVMIFSAHAQPAETILVLSSNDAEHKTVAAGFKRTFSGSFREVNLEGSDEKQRTVGEELKAKKPALVVVVGDMAAQMAKWYLEDVPIIYCDSVRATKISLTTSKAIGIYHEPDPGEQLQIMHELFSGKTRVGLLYSPEHTNVRKEEIKEKSEALGITIEITAMGSVKEVPGKLKAVMSKVDLLWVFTDPVILSHHSNQYIVLQSITAKLPIFCGDLNLAHGGATAALVPDLEDVGSKAADQAKLVLGGSAPSRGTTLYPKGKLVLNQKIATLMKVSFPASLVNRATEVIR